jgi:dTDP-glucose pyrophosphorylase
MSYGFQVVIPMAGAGSRFVDAGYTLPKPLIPVGGVPMVVRTIHDLPSATKVVCLVRAEHIRDHTIDQVLKDHVGNVEIVPIDGLTSGQATTVSLSGPYLNPDQAVIVAACDNTHVYDQDAHARLLEHGADCLLWSYRNDPRADRNPKAYGWISVEGDSTQVTGISCKVPLSDTPQKDHAVTGFFTFARADAMIAAIKKQEANNRRINNEFYMETVPEVVLANGGSATVFEVKKYIGWGTPAEYEDYLLWQEHFEGVSAPR